MTHYTFRNATTISSVSKSYINWAHNYANINTFKSNIILPLVSPKDSYTRKEIKKSLVWLSSMGVEDDNNAKFLFIGSLSRAFNFEIICNFSDLLFELEPNAKIIIGGTGPCEKQIRSMMKNKKNVIMLGWVKGANIKNLYEGKRLVGASTITQQLAKNFLLSNEVSLNRKIRDALLSLRIERILTKDDILELYLNEILLGKRS